MWYEPSGVIQSIRKFRTWLSISIATGSLPTITPASSYQRILEHRPRPRDEDPISVPSMVQRKGRLFEHNPNLWGGPRKPLFPSLACRQCLVVPGS